MNLNVGTRGSPLALTQTKNVVAALTAAHPGLAIEIVPIVTAGDKRAISPESSIGTKGVFVKEIEEALLAKQIDFAVHSMKDMPGDLPPGLVLGPTPKREDSRDAFISRFGELLNELPKGSSIGTSSPRRRAQIRYRFRARRYRIESIRGNVDTRLRKVQEGNVDAIVVAAAGLKRLGLEKEVTEYLEPAEFFPAPCQGCLALELREDDKETAALLAALRDVESDTVARAERAFLRGLGGDCTIPVGAFSVIHGDELRMRALLLDEHGDRAVASEQAGPADSAELVGMQLAERLLFDGGSELMLAPGELPKK